MRRVCLALIALLVGVAPAFAGDAPPRLEGEWIVFRIAERETDDSDLYRMRPDGSEMLNLTNRAGEDSGGELSPDGTAIAFRTLLDGVGTIMLMDVDGADRRPVAEDGPAGRDPTWTPDGRSIVYAAADGLRIVGRDGADDRLVTDLFAFAPRVSPDGEWVVFQVTVGDSPEVFRTRLDGSGEPEQLTFDHGIEPVWSPDGSEIVFASFRDGYGDNIHVMNADGSDQRVLLSSEFNDFHPAWSPDGTRVAVHSVHTDRFAIDVYDIATGEYTPLLEGDDQLFRDPRWTAVTLEPVVIAPPVETTTTTTTEVPATTTTVVVTTTTAAAAEEPTDDDNLPPLLWMAIGGAAVALVMSLAWLAHNRRRPTPPPPPLAD